MKRKLLLGAMLAAFLAVPALLSPPAEAQIGIGRTDSELTLSGQLSIADGTVSDPSIVFTSDDDGTGTGIYREGANLIAFANNGVNTLVVLSTGLRVNPQGTAGAPSVHNTPDTNSGMYWPGADNLGFTVGGALVLDLENTNAAGASANLATISSTLGIFNGSDTVNGLSLEVTNVNHTGTGNTVNLITLAAITGDANSNLNGISIGALTGTTGAASEAEVAINIANGWDLGLDVADGGIAMGVTYEDYEVPCGALQTDGTVQSNADTEVNDIVCPSSGLHHTVINVGVNTAFAFANPTAGGVTMFNTATDNIGEEVRFASDPLVGYGAVGTTGVYFVEFSITIANISAFDGNLGIGLMLPEASVAGVQDNLDTYSLFTLSDNAGDLDLECDTGGGGQTNDDTGITWADTNTKVLRVELQVDGGTVALVDGVAVTSTNCNATGANDWTAADKIVPFIMGSTGSEGVSTGFVLNYIKFGEV